MNFVIEIKPKRYTPNFTVLANLEVGKKQRAGRERRQEKKNQYKNHVLIGFLIEPLREHSNVTYSFKGWGGGTKRITN